MDGQISIVRPGACDDREIRIIIRLAMGKAITALITPENLALALTGKSDLPIVLKLRNVEVKVKSNELSCNYPGTPAGWISCSERMPEKNQNVLISVNFDSSLVEPLICSARYTGSTFRRGDATIKPGNGIEQATHWMPLPEPPEQDGE